MDRFQSHVVSWNLTKKCNLRCEHCYIEAGVIERDEALDELSTDECFDVIDQLATVNPEALLILTGGEPLLRRDVFAIAQRASDRGLWPVVGTNGVFITEELSERMIASGIRGVSLSLDALDAETHDRFRGVQGAWQNTVNGAEVLTKIGLPFIVQTTVGSHNHQEIPEIAEMAHALGARVFNLYFLVPTGRGAFISDLTAQKYEDIMGQLQALQRDFSGRMVVNSKCAPHYQRYLYEREPDSPFLKTFSMGAGGCPAGTHYVGIRPNGDVTPCPYLPVYGGNLRETPFQEIWDSSKVFTDIRKRNDLGGRCGPCEFSQVCGGCRARAFGATGDFLAEDPWCVYEPGKYGGERISFDEKTTYGIASDQAGQIFWTEEAKTVLKAAPSFVRGMVRKRAETHARDQGKTEITGEMMHTLRKEAMNGRIGNVPSFVRKMMGSRTEKSAEDAPTQPQKQSPEQ
jgi:radical SAM protein with 4Fe4S-binding SPASM domain